MIMKCIKHQTLKLTSFRNENKLMIVSAQNIWALFKTIEYIPSVHNCDSNEKPWINFEEKGINIYAYDLVQRRIEHRTGKYSIGIVSTN